MMLDGRPAMVEAADRTTGTPAEIWAIVIVAVVALVFWLTAIVLADRSQVRASGPRVPGESRLAGRGGWAGGSVAGGSAPEIPGTAEHEPVETPGESAPQPEGWSTRADVPAGAPAGQHATPRQRAADDDRAERSYAGQSTPDDEQPGR
jgi:hypothetical protein